MPIALTPLPNASSTIDAAGYEVGSRTLAVRFKSGEVYHYRGVEPEVASGLVDADSAGRYLHANIRNQYEHERIAEADAGD